MMKTQSQGNTKVFVFIIALFHLFTLHWRLRCKQKEEKESMRMTGCVGGVTVKASGNTIEDPNLWLTGSISNSLCSVCISLRMQGTVTQ